MSHRRDETTDTGDIDYGMPPETTPQQRLPSTGDDHRDAAPEFSLDIIQTYFDNDAPSWGDLSMTRSTLQAPIPSANAASTQV